MTISILFLGEGSSDSGIVPHIEALAAGIDVEVTITNPDLGRLKKPPGNAVADKLKVSIEIGGMYDLIVVHRDTDRDGRDARLSEIASAVNKFAPGSCYAPVIPVRMTEAWLLADEHSLRQVAGNPKGRVPLNLPPVAKLEKISDPKQMLKEILGKASGQSGRNLTKFHTRFPQHRRQLLERLDPEGSIGGLSSWQHFIADVNSGLRSAIDHSAGHAN